MFLADAGEKKLLELLAEIAVVVAYPHEAVLDNVGHNHFFFCSTFYLYSMRKGEMLHGKWRKMWFFCNISWFFAIFARKRELIK